MQQITHPEDIKAALRKRFGSLGQFEAMRGLKRRSVTDVLRGKSSRQTAEAIARELGVQVQELFPGRYLSADADDNATNTHAHRLNEAAQ